MRYSISQTNNELWLKTGISS